MAEQYPLEWPMGFDRTTTTTSSRFGIESIAKAVKLLRKELNLFGAEYVVISSNAHYKHDGDLYAKQGLIDDKGVAVYFTKDDNQHCIPCDRWNSIAENIWAIAKSIGAMRGLDRWGSKSIVDAAFSGFRQLPAPEQGMVEVGVVRVEPWWEVLGVERTASPEMLRVARNVLARRYHPDSDSEPNHAKMSEVNVAFDQGMKANGGGT